MNEQMFEGHIYFKLAAVVNLWEENKKEDSRTFSIFETYKQAIKWAFLIEQLIDEKEADELNRYAIKICLKPAA